MQVKVHVYARSGHVSTPGIDFGPGEVKIHHQTPKHIVLKIPGSSLTHNGYQTYHPARFLVLVVLEEGVVDNKTTGAPAYRWYKCDEVTDFPVKAPPPKPVKQEALSADRARSLPDAVRESLRENPLPPAQGDGTVNRATGPDGITNLDKYRLDRLKKKWEGQPPEVR